jgi:hypothetical protein
MNDIKASAYFYLFNVKRFSFPYREAVANFCTFFDEVICATIKDEDDSASLLHALALEFPNFHVVETDIKLGDNRFDGKLKTEALKRCTHPIRVIMDGDERVALSNKPKWREAYARLLNSPGVDGLLVPVIDEWGARDQINVEKDIGQKFRIHKDTVVTRGVIPSAELSGGRFDTSRSDSTEPLLTNGSLANFVPFVPRMAFTPMLASMLAGYPYVLHEGYLDLQARIKLNTEFWKGHWENRSGHEERVETNLLNLSRAATIPHGLPLV